MKFRLLLCILALTAALPVRAQLKIEDASGLGVSPEPLGLVGEIGERPKMIRPLTTEGRKITLSAALKAIVPEGWQGFNRGGHLDSQVSWSRAEPWTQALDRFMRESGNRAVVDWEHNRVTIFMGSDPKPAVARNTTAVAAAKIEGMPPRMAEPAKVQKVEPAPWVAKNGGYLRETLKEWTTRAGWGLAWALGDDDDIHLGGGDTYRADFQSAVTDLFNSLSGNIHIRAKLVPDNTPPLLYVTRDDRSR